MYIAPFQMKPNDPDGFTIDEAEYIYGRKDPCDASTRALNSICKKATRFNLSDVYDTFSVYRDERADQQKNKIKQKMKESLKRHQQNIRLYGDNYTPRQQQIIDGVISFEDATGYEYNAIRKVAKRKDDIAVFELMETLLQDKKAEYREQQAKQCRFRDSFPSATESDIPFTKAELFLLYGSPQYDTIKDSRLLLLYNKVLLLDDLEMLDRIQFILSLYGLSGSSECEGSESFEMLSWKEYLFTDAASIIQSLKKNVLFPIKMNEALLLSKPLE